MAVNFPILSLPNELKRRTASFLSPRDAMRLSETCRSLHSNLSLRLLRNSRVLFQRAQHFTGDRVNGDQQRPFVRIPCISRRVHSMTITFRWRDQGWGNRKGQLWVVARDRSVPIDESKPFHGGKVICESVLAPHETEEYRMTFLTSSMDGEVYQLWYRAGSGGGHSLHLFDGRLNTVIFDDEQGNLSRNYTILRNVGAIGLHPENALPTAAGSTFYPELLLRVSRTLRSELVNRRNYENGSREDELAAFFRMFHISVNEGSLLALEEIIQSDLDQQALMQRENNHRVEEEQEEVEADAVFVLRDLRDLLIERNDRDLFHDSDGDDGDDV